MRKRILAVATVVGTLVLAAFATSPDAPFRFCTSPDGRTAIDCGSGGTVAANSSGLSARYQVINGDTQSHEFSYGCSHSGSISSCADDHSMKIVPAGGRDTVVVSFSTGAAGSAALSLSVTSDGGADNSVTGTYDFTVQ